MGTLVALFVTLCAILPAWVVALALAIIAVTAIIVIIKIVGLILDAIPFL